jgi:hypothetical protein
MKTLDLSRVITSQPINRTANAVTKSGTHYEPVTKPTSEQWFADMPPVVPISRTQLDNPGWVNLTGVRYENVTAIGPAGDGRWVCRCVCGRYVYRKTRTLKLQPKSSCGPNCCPVCENARRVREGQASFMAVTA